METAGDTPGDAVSMLELPFVDPAGGSPVNYYHAPERNVGRYAALRVPVSNGRMLSDGGSLDREGFHFLRSPTTFRDFYDPEAVRARYYPEVADLVRAYTKASRVVVYEHVVRGDAIEQRGAVQVRAPAGFMHNDFTPDAARRRIRDLLPEDEADRLLGSRFIQLNLWRPIVGPLRKRPLAICDASTMQDEDFLVAVNHTPVLVNEFYVAAYREGQRWYSFPDMEPDEAVFIKNYDSAASAGRIGAHGAVEDSATPPGALPRASIETRVFAFFSGD